MKYKCSIENNTGKTITIPVPRRNTKYTAAPGEQVELTKVIETAKKSLARKEYLDYLHVVGYRYLVKELSVNITKIIIAD